MLQNKDFLVLLIRLFLGYVFFSAGVCKLTHGNFGQLIGPPWLEERLAEYGLSFFAQVVAVCQVVLGTLLFTQRFSTLGAVMLVPMNIAILAVTISQNWAGTPYVNAVFLAMNLALLLYDRKRFQFLFSIEPALSAPSLALDTLRTGKLPWAVIGAALLTLGLSRFNYPLTNAAGLLTFCLAGATVILPHALDRLQKLIVLLAVGNMCFLTLGMKLPYTHVSIAICSGGILVLLVVHAWLHARQKRTASTV
ncbi:DoxX family membrane protein [Nibribacter ruber]|uniref:DoxX family membrane protein n=1 Tax=Nibribacter ruber TaxID=2698458 RepID=A0A6P1P0Z5_9BACT|nr:DoxX family membrane protein [Nibribacter ruber]QHL88101.1 DoxX family membrane protein [Nibribacter ruber]